MRLILRWRPIHRSPPGAPPRPRPWTWPRSWLRPHPHLPPSQRRHQARPQTRMLQRSRLKGSKSQERRLPARRPRTSGSGENLRRRRGLSGVLRARSSRSARARPRKARGSRWHLPHLRLATWLCRRRRWQRPPPARAGHFHRGLGLGGCRGTRPCRSRSGRPPVARTAPLRPLLHLPARRERWARQALRKPLRKLCAPGPRLCQQQSASKTARTMPQPPPGAVRPWPLLPLPLPPSPMRGPRPAGPLPAGRHLRPARALPPVLLL